ncbi:hypothetical protein Agub_g9336 [Astrephomene gubernaculifera]|uniref:Uncharacterized protein n=1 Tax=Astrephomene gubernaculifera TaxID=47775 RepID=A0AAD3HP03_9CHLO|nr:hypothetical protein Agub_g9336 [Astrephomene gubernaculifera]
MGGHAQRMSLDNGAGTAPAKPSNGPSPPFFTVHDPHRPVLDPTGDGCGGIGGLMDPYDRPTRSQLKGAQSRLRMDKRSGALDEVAGRYRALFAGHQVVNKGLRRSIGDAYAAYVGQVVNLPEDTYGLALRALDASFNGPRQRLATGSLDLHLATSPFATSRAKHAQIFNTAHRIMRDLGGYVHDVSYFCPAELHQLHQRARRPTSAAAAVDGSRQSYKSGPLVQSCEPPELREAVRVAPRAASAGGGRGGPARRYTRIAAQPPDPNVNPITGALRSPQTRLDAEVKAQARRQAAADLTKQPPSRPRTAPPAAMSAAAGAAGGPGGVDGGRRAAAAAGGGGGGVGGLGGGGAEEEEEEAAAREVAGGVGTAACGRKEGRLEEQRHGEQDGADDGGGGGGGPDMDGIDLWKRQLRLKLRRLSSPGSSPLTPPHYRVGHYYQHVTPTADVLHHMRRRMSQQHTTPERQRLQQQQQQQLRWGEQEQPHGNAAEVMGGRRSDTFDPQPRPEGEDQEQAGQGAAAAVDITGAEAAAITAATAGESGQAADAPSGIRGSSSTAGHQVRFMDGGSCVEEPPAPVAAQQPQPVPAAARGGEGAYARRTIGGVGSTDPWVTSSRNRACSAAGARRDMDRINWIIDTAYELGLAEVIGLEPPPPYGRSHRVLPLPHRKQFYEGVYGSPERYRPYVPYTRRDYSNNNSGNSGDTSSGINYGGGWPAPPQGHASVPEQAAAAPQPPPSQDVGAASAVDNANRRTGGVATGYGSSGYPSERSQLGAVPYGNESTTARRIQEAAARRFVREMEAMEHPAKLYGRSMRISP